MDTRQLWSQESMETADMGTKYLGATTRRAFLALLPLCFGERLGMVARVAASRGERHRAQRLQRMRRCTIQEWILPRQRTLLHDGSGGCVLLVRVLRARSAEDAAGWRLQHEAATPLEDGRLAVERRSLWRDLGARRIRESGAFGAHTDQD